MRWYNVSCTDGFSMRTMAESEEKAIEKVMQYGHHEIKSVNTIGSIEKAKEDKFL